MESMVETLVLLALASPMPVLTHAQVSEFQHIVIVYQENRTTIGTTSGAFSGLSSTTSASRRVRLISGTNAPQPISEAFST